MHVYHANELRRGNQLMTGGHEIYVNASHKHSLTPVLCKTQNSYNLVISIFFFSFLLRVSFLCLSFFCVIFCLVCTKKVHKEQNEISWKLGKLCVTGTLILLLWKWKEKKRRKTKKSKELKLLFLLFFSSAIIRWSRFKSFRHQNYMLIQNMKCKEVAKEMNKITRTHTKNASIHTLLLHRHWKTVNDVKRSFFNLVQKSHSTFFLPFCRMNTIAENQVETRFSRAVLRTKKESQWYRFKLMFLFHIRRTIFNHVFILMVSFVFFFAFFHLIWVFDFIRAQK